MDPCFEAENTTAVFGEIIFITKATFALLDELLVELLAEMSAVFIDHSNFEVLVARGP